MIFKAIRLANISKRSGEIKEGERTEKGVLGQNELEK